MHSTSHSIELHISGFRAYVVEEAVHTAAPAVNAPLILQLPRLVHPIIRALCRVNPGYLHAAQLPTQI